VYHDALVVGLSRTSTKWKSVSVVRQSSVKRAEASWPLRQLANLCRVAETRYGYIQTDEELVVCCFGATPMIGERREKVWNNWTVDVMPVPWNTEVSDGHGPRILTTDLALWWLCMLALCDGNRETVAKSDMVPIDAWDTMHTGDERGWVRRHRYSMYEEATNTSAPPAYQTPSPANPAAFAANVGLNGDDWFDLVDPSAVDLATFDPGLPVPGNVNFRAH
jgi:hypothetical protein